MAVLGDLSALAREIIRCAVFLVRLRAFVEKTGLFDP
jgi:hypothetical protein